MLLDEGAATKGAVSKVWTMLPTGGTVAMGSVCIRDAPVGIDGMATVDGTCVFVPASIVCMTAGPRFLTDALSSLICSGPCDRGCMEDAAACLCCGCMTGPGVVTVAPCCAGREESKDGVRAITEHVGTNGLLTTGKDDTGADVMDKECATRGEHSACAGVPAGNILLASAGLATGTLFTAGGIRPGAPNLDGKENRAGVHTGSGAKFPFVLPGDTAEPMQSAVIDRGGATVAAHATKG